METISLLILVIIAATAPAWIAFKAYGEANMLGVIMVMCRKSKYTKWLTWQIWGDESWYLDDLERRMTEWKTLKKRGR